MPQEQAYKVVTTRTAPGFESSAISIDEVLLSAEELSARYPRERTRFGGNLVLAKYQVQTGEYDADTYEEFIAPVDGSEELSQDPRDIDTEVDSSVLPEGYEVGEGYGKWQARVNGGEYQHGGRYYIPDSQTTN